MVRLGTAAFCAAGLLAVFAAIRAQGRVTQLAAAGAKAQSRISQLEQLLKEQEARRNDENHASCPPASPSCEMVRSELRDAARVEVRLALLEATRAGAAPALSNQQHSSDLVALARFELREALAAEDSGWCNCPTLNITQLCRALGTPRDSWEREAARSRDEADGLRLALLEANARAQEASERAIEAAALLKRPRQPL